MSSVALAIPPLHVRPDQLPLYELAYVAALSLVPGALIGFFGHTRRARRVFSVAWVLAFAVLLEATIVRVSGGAFHWVQVAQAAGVGAGVLTVFNAIFSSGDRILAPAVTPGRAEIARRERVGIRRRSFSRATLRK